MSTAEKLLTVSFVVNLSVGLFHFLPGLVIILLRKLRARSGCAEQLLKLSEEKPWILSKFFVDQLSSVVVTILAIVVIPASGIIYEPFLGMPWSVQIAIATDIGHYTYKLAQDFCLRSHYPSFRINALHHVVSIITLAVFLAFEQNGLTCLVGLLFEGNLVFFGVSHLLKALHVEGYNRAYGMNKYAGFVSTVLFRGILPLLFLVVSLVFGNPFSMDYISIAFYFLSDIFFLILNLWLMKISFDSVRKYRTERQKHLYISDLMPADNQSRVSVDSATVADKSQMYQNHMKYLNPIANANLNAETAEGRISNIQRNRETVTNIREVLVPVPPNNARPAVSLGHNFSSRNSLDSRDSSTASGPVVVVQRPHFAHQGAGDSGCPEESLYAENLSLGSVRAPPDGEDSSAYASAPPPRAHLMALQQQQHRGTAPTMAPSQHVYCPRPTGAFTTDQGSLEKRSLSDSSLSDAASVHSSSSKSSCGKFTGVAFLPTTPQAPFPPPYVAHWKNTNNLTTETRARTDSKTSSDSVGSTDHSRTSHKSGDSSNSAYFNKDGNPS